MPLSIQMHRAQNFVKWQQVRYGVPLWAGSLIVFATVSTRSTFSVLQAILKASMEVTMQEPSLCNKPILPHLMTRYPIQWQLEEGVLEVHRVGLQVQLQDYNIAYPLSALRTHPITILRSPSHLRCTNTKLSCLERRNNH
jgi:hypothetical protein